MYLLGYDIGSSSVKASLVNAETGKCVAGAFYPKSEAGIIAVKKGWAEQDPEEWWKSLKYATRDVLYFARYNFVQNKKVSIFMLSRHKNDAYYKIYR